MSTTKLDKSEIDYLESLAKYDGLVNYYKTKQNDGLFNILAAREECKEAFMKMGSTQRIKYRASIPGNPFNTEQKVDNGGQKYIKCNVQ